MRVRGISIWAWLCWTWNLFCHLRQAYYFKRFSFLSVLWRKEKFCRPSAGQPLHVGTLKPNHHHYSCWFNSWPSCYRRVICCKKQKTSQSLLSLSLLFYLITESSKARKVLLMGTYYVVNVFFHQVFKLICLQTTALKLIINVKPQFIW